MKCIKNSLIHNLQGKRARLFFVFSILQYDDSVDTAVREFYLNRSTIVLEFKMTLLWCSSKFAQLYKLSLCNKINIQPFLEE